MGNTNYLIDTQALLFALVNPRPLNQGTQDYQHEHHVRRIAPSTINITTEHALTAAELKWDHGDPFDRLIAAQSLIEGATLITADSEMHKHEPLNTLW